MSGEEPARSMAPPSGRELLHRLRTLLPGRPLGVAEIDGDRPVLRRASVLVPIYEEEGEPTLLLVQRSADLGKHPGQLAFPGGGRDPGEDDLTCALREMREEIGISPNAVEVLGRLDPRPTYTGFLVSPFVGFLPEWPLPLLPEPGEVAGVLHVPMRRLLDPALLATHELQPGRRVDFFHVDDEVIWGATARIVRELLELALGRRLEAAGSVPWEKVRW